MNGRSREEVGNCLPKHRGSGVTFRDDHLGVTSQNYWDVAKRNYGHDDGYVGGCGFIDDHTPITMPRACVS